MLSPQELAETVTANHALLVLDAGRVKVLYQNAACRELFGELMRFADLQDLRETSSDDFHPNLKSVVRLGTRQGVCSYVLQSMEQSGMVVQVLKDISDLEDELEDMYRNQNVGPLSRMLNPRSTMYALVR